MKMETVTPTLRFPVFKGDWAEKKFGDIASIRSASRVHKDEWTVQGVPFFRSSDVVSRYKGTDNKKAYISRELFDELSAKSGKIKRHDLLVTGGGSIGVPYLVPNDAPLYFKDADLLWFKKSEQIHSYFLYTYFSTAIFRRYLTSVTHIGTIAHYTIEQAKATPVTLPTLPEQRKIADFSAAVDERIKQLVQKKALLTEYKKGVMQQLFTQAIRFKDDQGNDFPNWEQVRLVDVADSLKKWSFTGGPFGSNLKSDDYTETGVRIIQLQNIGDGEFLDSYKIYTSEKKADELLSCNIYPGDLILSKMGDPVARACIIPNHEVRYVMCSDGIRLAVDESKYDRYFVFCQINHQTFRNTAITVGTGSTRKRIGLTELREIPLLAPSIAEQTKIGNFLASLDSKIESVGTQIYESQTFKRGLLQQMFV